VKEYDLFEQFLFAEDESDIDSLLRREGFGLDNEAVWRQLGDMENNFSTVGNQQTEATGALVEKLINGIDAILMAECLQRKVDPESPSAPQTMAEAVERFFKIKAGRLENLSAAEQTVLADNLHLVAVGAKPRGRPSYLVIDRGEGQEPDAFPETFCSLNRSNKLKIPFVQGKFNAGGTGVLQFCGEQNMQLIVSRRLPDLASKDQSWGFTLVRRMRPTAGRRSSMYVYLAPDGKVLRFLADSIPVLPQIRRSIQPDPYKVGLKHGTCIKLYNFRWRAPSLATTEARYELERFLHSPCLPFRLTETRDYRANYFSTTVSGVTVAVAAASEDEESTKLEPGFPAYATLNLNAIGDLPYEIVVFSEGKSASSGRRVPNGISFTVNGQVHGSLPSNYVSQQLKFDYLKNHLLVSVDCTGMDSSVREDFFMASRDRVRKNEVYDELVDRLREALREHPGLKALNAARRKRELEKHVNNEEETSVLFNELLKRDPTLAALFNSGRQLVTSLGPGTFEPFKPRKFPSHFQLTKRPANGLIKRCPINRTCRVEFETDAPNDYFQRADSPGTIVTEPANLIESSHLWNGQFNAHFRVPWNVKAEETVEVKVIVKDVESEAKGGFVSTFTLVAAAETDEAPREGGKRTNPTPTAPSKAGKAFPRGLQLPEITEVHKDDWVKRSFTPYTALEVKHGSDGGYDFFLNVENAHMLTELTKAKETDQPLIKYWFKYGLVLCALGMLQEQHRRQTSKVINGKSNGEENGDDESAENLEKIGRACSGIAQVIVPVIRALYRGPEAGPAN
jgi:hypothetical protein